MKIQGAKKGARFIQNLPFAISGAVLLALWVAGNSKKLVLLAGLLGLAAACVLSAAPALRPWLKTKLNWPAVLCALLLAAGGGVQFAGNWRFQGVADRLQISAGVLVGVLGVLAALTALPAALALCAFALAEADDTAQPDRLTQACRRLTQSRALAVLLLALAAGMLIWQGYFAVTSGYIWADEVFTLKLIRHPWTELVALTAVDVHPPLYYLIVKAAVALTPFAPTIAVAKLISLLPAVLLVVWAAVRALHGAAHPCAYALFAVCVAGMPSLTSYNLEIRMYSWGLLFVTACFVAAYHAATRGKRADWFAFAGFGLAAAYTHYFACIAVALAYLVLLGCCLVQKPRRVQAWLAAAGVTVAGYLPWLLVLVGQLRTVKENYWIQPITAEEFGIYFRFVFGQGSLWVVAAVVLLLLITALLRHKLPTLQGVWALAGVLAPVWVVLVGVAASLLIRPVFMERYLLPALGCLWLGVAAALALLPQLRIKPLLGALLVVFALGNLRDFTVRERYETGEAAAVHAVVDGLPDDTVLVSTAVRVQEKLAGMTEYDNYVWGDTLGVLPKSVYDNLYDFTDLEGNTTQSTTPAAALTDWAQGGRAVYFIEHQAAAGTAQRAALQAGLQAEKLADCTLGEPLSIWRLTA